MALFDRPVHTLSARLLRVLSLCSIPLIILFGITFFVLDWSSSRHEEKNAAYFLREARSALDAGDIAGAEQAFRRALEEDPGGAEAASWLARMDIIRGDLGSARTALVSLADRYAEDYPTRILLGHVLFELGDFAGATSAARVALDLVQRSADAHLLLGRSLLRMEEPEEAIYHLKNFLAYDKRRVYPCLELASAYRMALIRRMGVKGHMITEALVEGELRALAALEEDPCDNRIRGLLVRFLAEQGPGRVGQVRHQVRLLLGAASADPADPGAYLAAFYGLWTAGDHESALGLLETAESFFPADSRFALLRAHFQGLYGFSAVAAETLDRALRQAQPEEHPALLLARGEALRRCGRREEALKAFEEAASAGAPRDPAENLKLEQQVNRTVFLWEEGVEPETDLADITSRVEDALRRRPGSSDALRLSGRLALVSGRLADAVEALRMVAARGRATHDDLYYLGVALLALDRPGEAELLLTQSLAGRAASSGRLLTLARAHLRTGHVERAKQILEGLLAAGSGHPAIPLLRADLAQASGEDPRPFLANAFELTGDPVTALRLALSEQDAGSPEPASALMQVVAKSPADPMGWVALMRFHTVLGDPARALTVHDRIPDQLLEDPAIRTEQAAALLEGGRIEEARGIWDSLSSDAPIGYRAWIGAKLLLGEREFSRAAAEFRSAMADGAPRALALLGLARAHLGMYDWEGAEEAALDLLAVAPGSEAGREVLTQAAIGRAASLLGVGNLSAARDELSRRARPSERGLIHSFHTELQPDSGRDPTARAAAERTAAAHGRLFLLSALRLTLGRYRDSLQAAALARKEGNEEPRLYLIEGLCSLRLNRPGAALEAFQRAVSALPEDFAAREGLVRSLLELDRQPAALDAAEAAVAAMPDSPRALVLRGDVLDRMGESEAAENVYRQAIRTDPSSVTAVYRLILFLESAGRRQDATDVLRESVQRNSKSAPILTLQARHCAASGKPDEAEAFYRRAQSADPESLEIAWALADHFLRRRDRHALGVISQAILTHPRHPGLITMMAIALEIDHAEAQAIGAYEEALTLQPGLALAANNLALLLAERPGGMEKAVATARLAVANSREAPFALDTLGWLLYRTGEAVEALSVLKRAAEADPTHPLYRYHLGVAHLEVKDRDRARVELLRALDEGLRGRESLHARRLLDSLGR